MSQFDSLAKGATPEKEPSDSLMAKFDSMHSGEGSPQDDEPSALEAGARGLAQGASLGFADELTGAGAAALDKLKGDKRSLHDAYVDERDDSRKKYEEAEKAHPTLYRGAQIAGGVGSTAALAGLTGGGSLAAEAALGATAGGINAAGESTADTAGGVTADALKGVAGGALAGGAGYGLGKLGGAAYNAAMKKVAPALSQKLDALAVAQGRRVLTGGADSLSGRAALPDAAVKEALDSGAIKAFGTTKGASDRLTGLREQLGAKYGDILKQLEAKGITGPRAQDLADKWLAQGVETDANTLGSKIPDLYINKGAEVLDKAPESGNLGLSQAESMKRQLQGEAKYGLYNENDINEAKQGVASDLKKGIEDSIQKQTTASSDQGVKDLGQQFKPVKDRLGNVIAADNAAFKGADQASKRRAFSLSDNMMGAAGLASGNPAALAAGPANNLLRTRGTSTAAVAFNGLSKAFGKIGAVGATNPARLGKYAGVITSSLQRGPQAFAATNFVLQQRDPQYAKLVQDIHAEPDEPPP